MDKLDKEFFPLLGSYTLGKTYYLKEILLPPNDMMKLVNRLYIFKKRGYIELYAPEVYSFEQLNGKPSWFYMSFKILANTYIQKYYLKETSKQLKLDL